MAKIWDHLMKLLAKANPQHLVSLLLPGAIFVSEALNDLQVQSRQIQADILYNVIWQGQEIILHVEFQRRHDEDMGKRAWAYNALSTILNQRPTRTFVIYLVKDHSIVQPPYQLRLDSGELIHQFYYQNIYLWELSTDMLKQPGLEGMLPLLPLGKDGAQRAVVEEVITGLQAANKKELITLAYTFAALVFDQPEDRQWLQRRFDMLHDILEESWAYKEIVQKGLAQGMQKQQGMQQGVQQGRNEERLDARRRELRHQRQVLSTYIEKHFPDIVPLAIAQTNDIDDPEVLQRLLLDLLSAQSDDEVEQAILSISEQLE